MKIISRVDLRALRERIRQLEPVISADREGMISEESAQAQLEDCERQHNSILTMKELAIQNLNEACKAYEQAIEYYESQVKNMIEITPEDATMVVFCLENPQETLSTEDLEVICQFIAKLKSIAEVK